MHALDPFEPRHEPAKSIYLAFQAEVEKRRGRTVEQWVSAERGAVLNAATRLATERGLRIPSLSDVERAERAAYGSVDYGLKWARGVARAMTGR